MTRQKIMFSFIFAVYFYLSFTTGPHDSIQTKSNFAPNLEIIVKNDFMKQKTHTEHCQNFSLYALWGGRAKDLFSVSEDEQFAVIGQPKMTHVVTVPVSVGLPSWFVRFVVHDQVAVLLQTQAGSTSCLSVWGPHGLPAVDDKVSIILHEETGIFNPQVKKTLKSFELRKNVWSPGRWPCTVHCWTQGCLLYGAHYLWTYSFCSFFCKWTKRRSWFCVRNRI